jgi:hypothetical protein
MLNLVSYLGMGLIAVGFLWGLLLAFQRSILTGFLSLLVLPLGVLYFLVMVRPQNYQRPLSLMGIGLLLLIATSAFIS